MRHGWVDVLLATVQLADDDRAVWQLPEEVAAPGMTGVVGVLDEDLQLGKHKTVLDHDGAGHGLTAALAARVCVTRGFERVPHAGTMASPFADQSAKLGSVDSQARETRVCDCEALSKAELEEAIDYGVLKRGDENAVEPLHHWPGCLGAPVTCDAARAACRRPAFA